MPLANLFRAQCGFVSFECLWECACSCSCRVDIIHDLQMTIYEFSFRLVPGRGLRIRGICLLSIDFLLSTLCLIAILVALFQGTPGGPFYLFVVVLLVLGCIALGPLWRVRLQASYVGSAVVGKVLGV